MSGSAILTCWLVLSALLFACDRAAVVPPEPQTVAPGDAGDQGVTGSVAGSGGAAPGVSVAAHGDCIEVLDSAGGTHVATGACDDHGNFRVALAPGTYVVIGAGQRRTVAITPGQWSSISFRLHVP